VTFTADGRGESARGDRVSYWLASTPRASLSEGDGRGVGLPTTDLPVRADVVVVGAGIVGLTTAYLLCQAGTSVVLLEADEVAAGVSGYTSAKLTVGHGLAYSRLQSAYDADAAQLYAESQSAALALVRTLCIDHSIECDLETVPNFVFAESADELEQVRQEIEAASHAGLPASLAAPAEVPVPCRGAVRLEGQAQFHVRKYLLALTALVAEHGILREGGRVTEITVGPEGGHRVSVGDASVDAGAVVVATHYPIVGQGFFLPRIHPRRSYVVAARLRAPSVLDGMFINVRPPTRSFRTTPLPDGSRLLLVGGEGHRVGQEEDTEGRYATLEQYMRDHFEVGETEYRWSTQDLHPVDGLPYIGQVEDHPGLFVATGFAGWGMTNGTLAGMLIADAIQGAKPSWAGLYELGRRHLVASAARFLRENTNVAAQQIGGHYVRSNADSAESIGPGDGAVISIDGEELAASRDPDGTLRTVKAACTHMGCIVAWNKAESSWDCPCHGSRFAADGRILHGPALHPLETVPSPEPDDGEPSS
jgi:glycine/D-amino acid oxidase-like deaminating enzyme/nitrite reductase/ring-hydroxylating ferredoxin subunit